MRKVALILLLALGALAITAVGFASSQRVKGKFVPAESGSPVLGSAHVRPMGSGVWRTNLTLQHVWKSDYTVYVGTFVDANGDGAPQAGEKQTPVAVPTCDLSHPTKKGHAGCGRADATMVGTPYVVYLAVPGDAGPVFEAWANVKR
jgi:hypothetical protein